MDSDVVDFIGRNGLAAFQAADVLMRNEIGYGALGSIPVNTWMDVGLPEDEAEVFATDVGHVHLLHSCGACGGQKNHEDALGLATSIIRRLKTNDRKRYAEWKATRTSEGLKERVRRRMVIAVQHAQLRREMDAGDFTGMERDAGSFGDVAPPLEPEGEGCGDVHG